MAVPPVRYATTADGVSIAYVTGGQGPHTVAHIVGQPSHVEATEC